MIQTKKFKNGIKVHAIRTGTVSVKKEHFMYSGLGILRAPKILFGQKWVDEMPIWTWVIETDSGNYLIDTGESIDFYNSNHFNDKVDDYIYRKILKFRITREEEIDLQLNSIGLSPNKIDAVILTHLHLDHIDGIKYFPKSKILLSKIDWENPYRKYHGIPKGMFPKWFKGEKIDYEKSKRGFERSYSISKNLKIISTPGHTIGHQSVLLDVDGYSILFAGDLTFNQYQLKNNQIGGINILIEQSKKTIRHVQEFSKENNLIYLPSHDPESGERLSNLEIIKCN